MNNHDLAQVERLSTLEHVMESWGFDLGPTHDFIADVQKCLHFELDVDTTYTSHVSGDGTTLDTSGHVQVKALPLVEEPYLRFLSGAKQIDYLQFAASGGNANCTSTPAGTTLGDPFSARLSISPGGTATSTTPGIPAPVKLTLVVDPGTAKEHVHISCPRGKYDQVFDYTQFTGLWDRAAGLGRTFTEWNIAGGATYATFSSGTKTFTYEVGGETAVFTMNTTFTLRHTPG